MLTCQYHENRAVQTGTRRHFRLLGTPRLRSTKYEDPMVSCRLWTYRYHPRILLIQRPDTGGDVTAPNVQNVETEAPTQAPADLPPQPAAERPTPGDALPDKPDAEEPTMRRPGLPTPPTAVRPDEIPGPNPLAAEAQEKRSRPEAVQSGKASIPWTLIRRNLNRVETEQATQFSNQANQLSLDPPSHASRSR